MSDQSFVDPLQELMDRHNKALGAETSDDTAEQPQIDSEMFDDDPYGDNDLANEIAAEEAEREAEKQRRYEEAEAARQQQKKIMMPPDPYDQERTTEDVDFQGQTLQIVANMVQQVAYKNGLKSGGIPEATDADPDLRMHIMGELIGLYYRDGDMITDEFEQLVLSNWVGNDVEEESTSETGVDESTPIEEVVEQKVVDKKEPAQININVEGDTPVDVHIDENVVAEITETNQIDVVVRRTTKTELLSSKIVQNSQRNDIIVPYVSEMDDVPITLPMSAYRCTIRAVNYWEFIQLGSSPNSASRADADKKQWSIIYDHIKNASIGQFANFEDFMKKTKYMDRELLMWGVLIASAKDEETITIRCGNPKCKKHHQIKYNPRTLIHVNKDLIGKYEWNKTGTVAPGAAAIEHYEKINSAVRRYKLPNTGFIVEIDDAPSAYDFINRRYPLMDALRDRFKPKDDEIPEDIETREEREEYIEKSLNNNPEYSYLLAHAMFITAISTIKDGTEYRYTNWEDIETIITKSLDMDDAAILLQLVNQLASANVSPMEFYLEDFTCDQCKRHEDRIMIPDVGDSLIFQLSRRLSSTKINLIEMESN